MLNKWIGVGRVTKDIELKSTQSGISVVSFTVAINRQFTGSDGEKQVDFINLVAWRNLAENIAKYVAKGSLIAVEGRIQTRTYEADGGTKYVTEIACENVQFLESKKEDERTEKEVKDEEDMKKYNISPSELPF